MLLGKSKPCPQNRIKIRQNHIYPSVLEERLITAMMEVANLHFHNYHVFCYETIKIFIEHDSFKEIIAIHKELQRGDATKPGVIPTLRELVGGFSYTGLIIPYVYITHEVPFECQNVCLGSGIYPAKLIGVFKELGQDNPQEA
ncbi:hypothetical protein phytr_11280 [Candidatus Phycorickettsia trachydisci]|uniref:Uncharacterized protein n=1 Tax=Candidatus Phycorickettsia trachydisci TaxID=2115978 RepID=A0A2P1P9V8_9RICK|nr:hypothetical protein [Candidatus Phycorickettsia trachydisci]AVP88053.1 hypothetical protein phytr_11280 [Candidatus Phycorickettsia trachydisci]